MTRGDAHLELRNLRKRFGGLQAVGGCTFAIRRGSITGLIGPNGAGKSTVFNLIAGELAPTSGEIFLDGRPIQGLPPYRVARLGIRRTFQIPRALAGMAVLDNLMLVPDRQYGERLVAVAFRRRLVREQERQIRDRAMEVLRLLELERLAEAPAATLSGGQRKLLEVGRCVMANPRLILLDEPTAGVNPRLINDILTALRRIHSSGVTLAIIEHNMKLIMTLCEHIVVLDGGTVLCQGDPQEVQRDPRVIEAYLGAA